MLNLSNELVLMNGMQPNVLSLQPKQ